METTQLEEMLLRALWRIAYERFMVENATASWPAPPEEQVARIRGIAVGVLGDWSPPEYKGLGPRFKKPR